jgi:hypothetical protein
MHAMPGLRGFSLAWQRTADGVSCGEDGVFVGDVPLLNCSRAFGNERWNVRPINEINDDLAGIYRLPLDATAKLNAIALVAAALNRGDLAMAAIATVQMRFPDPPALKKGPENRDEIARRAGELFRSGLLKFWDPAKHPRTGTPPNPGWFAPTGGEPELVPAAMVGNPWDKPLIVEGGGGGGVPRGQLELPFPRFRWPWQSSPESPRQVPEPSSPPPSPAPEPWQPPEKPPAFPFMSEQPPQLAPYKAGGPTSGIFRAGDLTVELESGYDGPAQNMPEGSPGFDLITKGHVEGHAAAIMQQQGLLEGTLYINNPKICSSCESLLPSMLPAGSTLNVILPDNTVVQFKGMNQ